MYAVGLRRQVNGCSGVQWVSEMVIMVFSLEVNGCSGVQCVSTVNECSGV